MGYKIGSFNMKNFSYSSDKKIDKVAEIIKEEGFDIIAMQEILSEGKGIKNRVMRVLPNYWKCEFVSAKSSMDNRGEGYAFLWNSKKIDLVDSNDNPKVLTDKRYDLARKPAYARFSPINKVGGCFCELRILCVHLYYGSKSSIDIQKRQYEYDWLVKHIYPRVADKRYGNNMPAYTILLGDYNLNICNQINEGPFLNDSIEISDKGKIKHIVKTQEEKTSLKSNNDTKDSFEMYANNYDHFTYDSNRFYGTKISENRVDAIPKYYQNDKEKYNKEISDHVPVILNLGLK